MEKNSYEELTLLERQNLRKSMEKLKADASRILFCTRQLKVVHKHTEMVKARINKRSRELELREKELQSLSSDLDKRGKIFEANINKRSRELELKEKELQSLSSDLDKRSKIFEKEKTEAGDLKKLVEECTQELRSKRNELTAKLDTSTRIQREIETKKKHLAQYLAQVRKLCSEAGKVQIRKNEMEEETDRKKKDLAMILDQIKQAGKQLVMVDEQLESQRRLHEIQSSELESKERELECVRESIKLSNSDLELKENKVQSLNNCITVCVQEIDSKSKEFGGIQKLIEQQTSELLVMNNQRDLVKLFIQELSEEIVTKENRHKEILETISRSSSEMEEKAKEVKAAETRASDLNVRSDRLRQETEGKDKELDLLKNQIESEEKKLVQLKKKIEEETDSKKQNLVLILNRIEESGNKLVVVDEQVESQQRQLEMKSLELLSKEKELECVIESSKRSNFDLEVKENRILALNNLITISDEQLDLKSKELGEIQKLIEEQTSELCVMHKQHDSLTLLIQELAEELHAEEKRHKEILEAICRSSSEMESAETETRVLNVKSQRFRREVEDRENELDRLKNQINSDESKLVQLRKSIQDCTTELSSRRGQVEAMKNIQRELELKKQLRQMSTLLVKHEQQPASAPISDTSQHNATETEVVIEDALMHHGNLTILERHEVSSVLGGSLNPAEFILELVQGEIREEVDLPDSLVENWVLLFEELAKIQREDEPELQSKATQVATLWKRKITIEAPKSSLEALAFLLFIVAYGLEELINQEETALLASSIAQYEHAPTLFNSLKLDITAIVEYLITKRQYIPAVQLICPFKLDKDFPASHLLTKEIMDLRRSALERRPAESSQGKDNDAGRLRAVLELVADYKLEINLPGDLIAKLMIQRENSTPLVHCSARHHTSAASNPQANSSNLASAQRSSVSLRVPKPEVKPYLN